MTDSKTLPPKVLERMKTAFWVSGTDSSAGMQTAWDASPGPALADRLAEMKELFRFALLSTTPAIARDGMEFIRKAEAALALVKGGE